MKINTKQLIYAIITFAFLNNISAQSILPFTEINVGVNDMGTAIANIPIECNAGRNGMKPQVSIGYNSNIKHGTLGQNFTLNGISSISRGGKNYHLDKGVQAGVTHTTDDNFYLDGNKLILVSGTVGTNGCTYRTESDQFELITYKLNGSNSWFLVAPKGGGIRYYSLNAKVLESTSNININTYKTTPTAYYLTLSYDKLGNFISYEYNTDNLEEIILTKIKYNGFDCSYNGFIPTCSNPSISPNYEIEFSYNTNENNRVYMDGGYKLQSKTLDKIICKIDNGNTTVNTYTFSYSGNLLSSLKETTKPAINFNWHQGENDFKVNDKIKTKKKYFKAVGDFNGDGKSDILLVDGEIDLENNITINQIEGNYKFNIITTDNDKKLNNKTIMSGYLPFYTNYGKITNITVVDFDADGDDDIVLQEAYYSSGNCVYSYHLMKAELKQNTDGSIGFKEFIYIKNIIPSSSISGGLWFSSNYTSPYYVDLDGDGLPDLLEKNTTKTGNLNTLNATFSNNNYATRTSISGSYKLDAFLLMDFNGNGKKDIFIQSNFYLFWQGSIQIQNAIIEYNLQSNSFVFINNPFRTTNYDYESFISIKTGDFNGDGNSDLFYIYYNSNVTNMTLKGSVIYSNGKDKFINYLKYGAPSFTWGSSILSDIYCYKNIEIEIADFNNDGKDDIIARHDHNHIVTTTTNSDSEPTSLYGLKNSFIAGIPSTSTTITSSTFPTKNEYWIHISQGCGRFYNTSSMVNRDTIKNPSEFSDYILGDFDGDGKKDVLMIETANVNNLSNYVIEYHKAYATTLKEIVTPKKKYTFSFEQLPQYIGFRKSLNPALSQGLSMSIPIKVVTNLLVETANLAPENYHYYYKDLIYNRHGRGLLGFMEVTKTKQINGEINTTTTVNNFEQNYFLSHQLNLNTTKEYRNSSVQNGVVTPIDLMSETNYDYRLINTVAQKNEITFTFLSLKTETDYLTKKIKRTCFDYDINGNLIQTAAVYFPLSGTAPNYTYGEIEYSNATSYTYGQYLSWLPASVMSATNYKTRANQLTIVTPITYTYWPSNGLLKEKTTLGNSSPNQSVEAFEYDIYGNIIKKGLNNKQNKSSNYLRNTFIVYDANAHFISYTLNDLGHKTIYEFNKKLEKISKETAPNGLITNYEYDELGRLTKTTLPNGNFALKSYVWDQSNPASYFVVTESNNLGDKTIKHYNYKMQLIKEEKTPKFSSANLDKMSLKTYAYNGYGLLVSESNWNDPNVVSSRIFTNYEYDTYNRIILVKDNGTQIKKYEYNTNIITYTEGNNVPKVSTFDATGILLKVTEAGSLIKYTYNSINQPVSVDANGGVLTYEYNDQNLLVKQCDPNLGCIETKFNAFGETSETKDAKGNIFTYEYDAMGTLINKNGSNNTEYIYEYYDINLQANLNLPKTQTYKENGTIKNKLEYNYNALGELVETKEMAANGNTYTTTYTYDAKHRLAETQYPNIKLINAYDANNHLINITNATQPFLWANWLEHPDGRPIQTGYGNGYLNTFNYDNNLNLSELKSQRVGYTPNTLAMDIGYQFEMANKNLQVKEYLKFGNMETFQYDNLDRLNKISVYVTGQNPQYNNINFANNGNITNKYDAGTYEYSATKTNAVTSNTFKNSLSPVFVPTTMSEIQDFTYTPFNKVASLLQGSKDLTISYGFNQQRIHTKIKENNITTTEIYYIASANMEIVNGTEITYLYAQGQPFALHKKNSETEAINYLHLDYQGSVMAITNQNGTLLEERNYDVWGRPRTANTLEYVLPNPFGNGSAVKRGYTFHEHLEEFNIINMNGRVYDPVLARFLNADPLLQDNTDGQNYNRYSYVLNNPTKYTDPSGYAYNGFKASNDDIGASSTSSISDATAKIEEDYKGSKARDASSDEKFGSGGSDPGVNDPVDGDPTKPTTSGVSKTTKTIGNYGGYDGTIRNGFDLLYEINKFNPIANVTNAILGYYRGYDSYGVRTSNADATVLILSTIPVGKFANVSKNVASHIFRNAAGHVNPLTITSRGRYYQLFLNVSGNVKNLAPTLNAEAAKAGVLTYRQKFRTGEVWVLTLNGNITNAGVNWFK